jgi:hypothetical protein
MTSARARAEMEFAKATNSTATLVKPEAALFEQRRAIEAANLQRTQDLRALRLAHELANPKPKTVRRRRKFGTCG